MRKVVFGAPFQVGSVAGIPVLVGRSWPWFYLLFLVVFAVRYDLATVEGWVLMLLNGVLWTSVLLGAVLLHQVFHVLAAQACGLRVRRLEVELCSERACYHATPVTPARTALVAVAGPVANLAVALWAYVMRDVELLAVTWVPLMSLNLGLFLYAAMPVVTLDGGQVVTAVTWWLSRSRTAGLEAAAWAGRLSTIVVALFLAIPVALSGAPLAPLWGVVLAVVMWRATSRVVARLPARRLADQVLVRDAVHPAAVVAHDASLHALDPYPDGSAVIVLGDDRRPLSWAQIRHGSVPEYERDISDVDSVMAPPPPEAWVTKAALDDGVSDLVDHMEQVPTDVLAVEVAPGTWGLLWAADVTRLVDAARAGSETGTAAAH